MRCILLAEWPLDSSRTVEMVVILDSRDITGLAASDVFQELENRFGRCPPGKEITTSPLTGDQLENVEIGERLARSAGDFAGPPDASLRIDERAILFPPPRRGQHKIRHAGRLRVMIHVLHHQKIKLGTQSFPPAIADPRVN